jgi:hypothetical protein
MASTSSEAIKLMATSPKKDMKCGEVRKSTREGKKIMKKTCEGGKEKLIHAGDSSMRHNYSDAARKNFKARHNCSEAKPGTPKHLACTELWSKGKSVKSTGKGKPKK